MDALAGATKGIAAQKTLGDEARRVAQEVETMIGHIRRVPGVDMGAVDQGVGQLKEGLNHILRAVTKGKRDE